MRSDAIVPDRSTPPSLLNDQHRASSRLRVRRHSRAADPTPRSSRMSSTPRSSSSMYWASGHQAAARPAARCSRAGPHR
eukprot:5749381-Prymnesium_polylepis.1